MSGDRVTMRLASFCQSLSHLQVMAMSIAQHLSLTVGQTIVLRFAQKG